MRLRRPFRLDHDATTDDSGRGSRGIVYVHGALGYSRSVGVVSAYLVSAGLAKNSQEAVERVRALVPQTLLDAVWMERLREFEAGLPRPAAALR